MPVQAVRTQPARRRQMALRQEAIGHAREIARSLPKPRLTKWRLRNTSRGTGSVREHKETRYNHNSGGNKQRRAQQDPKLPALGHSSRNRITLTHGPDSRHRSSRRSLLRRASNRPPFVSSYGALTP